MHGDRVDMPWDGAFPILQYESLVLCVIIFGIFFPFSCLSRSSPICSFPYSGCLPFFFLSVSLLAWMLLRDGASPATPTECVRLRACACVCVWMSLASVPVFVQESCSAQLRMKKKIAHDRLMCSLTLSPYSHSLSVLKGQHIYTILQAIGVRVAKETSGIRWAGVQWSTREYMAPNDGSRQVSWGTVYKRVEDNLWRQKKAFNSF